MTGFRDGLKENLNIIQKDQFLIFWKFYIYEKFGNLKFTKETVHKRKRELILNFPYEKELEVGEILTLTPKMIQDYVGKNKATIGRDLKDLIDLELLVKSGKKYKANTSLLKSLIPLKKP